MSEPRAKVVRTPRVFSPDGKMLYGTWPGPQDRMWDFQGRYGLAAGAGNTGKSDLLRWLPWKQVAEEDARIKAGEITHSIGWALYLRREMPLLREVIARCQRDFATACPDIEWKAQSSTYVWPNGYRLTFGHMQNSDDFDRYQGWQLTMVLWDELATFTSEQFQMLDTWLRQPAGSKLTPIHRAGANPIGVGRAWVKKFFEIKKGAPVTELTRKITVAVDDEDGKRIETVERSQLYVQIKVSDNKSIDQAAYIASFDGKAKGIVAALRDGDWDSAAGDLVGQSWDPEIHVVKPYIVASTRHLFRAIHFSYAATTVIWVAVDFDGNFTVYRDLKLTNHTAEMAADRIREIEEDADEWQREEERGSKLRGPLGPASAWPKTGQRGPSAMETLRRSGVLCMQADDNIGAAADQIRQRLIKRTRAKGEEGEGTPGLRYFKACTASLETVPSMPADKSDADLPEPKTEGSSYLALVYACMSRPMIPEKAKPRDDDWESAPKPKVARKGKSGFPGAF